MAGYTRQSAATIITGADILASIFNAEFNQLQSAFNGTTGHTHSGGTGDGPRLTLTSAVSGILPVANGGTGVATITGIVVGNGTSVFVGRTLTAPAAGITVTNGTGVAGNPTLVLANDLAAVEGLGSTGIAVRSASDTWVQRTITGTAAEITVSNGDGVSGNPTLSLPTALTFTGKTITGGTYLLTGSTQSAAAMRSRVAGGDSFEFGNTVSGYGSTLGSLVAGTNYIAFHAFHGTNANTFQTVGTGLGSVFSDDAGAGGFVWRTIPLAATNNQAGTSILTLTTAGLLTPLSLTVTGGAVNLSNTTGAFTINPTTAGTINNVSLGATTRGSVAGTTGNFNSTLTANAGGSLTGTWSDHGSVTTIDINGGTVDGTTIGAASASTGRFTTLTYTTSLTLLGSATPTPTAEGAIEWDTDDDHFAVGNGTVTLKPGKPSVRQIFSASGTYTPTTGMRKAFVQCIGGGGGGSYCRSNASQASGGAGGGAGAYAASLLTAATIGASQTVTIGAGGAGGIGATPVGAVAGNDTSLGALVIAKGGAAGGHATSTLTTNIAAGAIGGLASTSTGDVKSTGGPGTMVVILAPTFHAPGNGGCSALGGGGVGVISGAGQDGTLGGGGGGASGGSSDTRNGGAGGNGIVIVDEYF